MNTMLSDQAVTKAQDIIIAQLGVTREQITAEAKIVEDLGADSLDVAAIVMEIEEQFNVALPDDRVERARSFGELCEELAALQNS